MNSRRRDRAGARGGGERDARTFTTGGIRVRRSGGTRETVESLVVVVLAFLLWSIEAEGFVIPTGSMAPTLLGRHKEVVCPECGYLYTVNADREAEPDRGGRPTGQRIARGTCENCRYETAVADAPSFSGDRIYVMKEGVSLPLLPAAGLVKPERWDVAVFKLPEEPEVRYIKRLVGMPDEVLRIREGDIWVGRRDGRGAFERPLRSPGHQQAMQIMVYDDRHRAVSLENDPAWRRWAPTRAGDWTEPTRGVFVSSADVAGWAELRYRHLVPSPDEWAAIAAGGRAGPPRPILVTDYSSYNTDLALGDGDDPRQSARTWLQPHWVGDLTLSIRLLVQEAVGSLRLDLSKGGVPGRCEVDLETGLSRLYHGELALGPSMQTGISRPGEFDLTFANVDGRLTLWVDGDLPFGEGISYPERDEPCLPTREELEPARIAVRGALVAIESLVLKRDVYYTIEPSETDFADLGVAARFDSGALFELLSDPVRLGKLARREPRDYPIAPGHYLMLGDNSPWSRDGRVWGRADQIDPARPHRGWDTSGREGWEVPESLLIGKAFCVYWPHLKPVWPRFRLGDDVRIPAVPSVERMRWIR